MPPNNPFVSNKRPRMETETAGPALTEAQDSSLPPWVTKSIDKSVRNVGNIQKAICKKQDAIEKLSDHVTKGTYPPSMQIKMAVMVSEDNQEAMNEVVSQAIVTCQGKIIDFLIRVRNEELKDLLTDLKNIETNWKEETSTTITQMKEDKLLEISVAESILETAEKQLKDKANEKILNVRTKHFLDKKERIGKANAVRTGEAENAMKDTLADPEVIKLQKQITTLEKKFGNLAKNAKGSSGKPPKPVQGPNSGNKKSPGGKKSENQGKSKKGDESGNGNRKPKKNSKPSTNQSGSKKKPSRKKQK